MGRSWGDHPGEELAAQRGEDCLGDAAVVGRVADHVDVGHLRDDERDGVAQLQLDEDVGRGLCAAQRARGEDENLADIARSVVKMGGGHPSREIIRKLFELIVFCIPIVVTINGSTDNLDLLENDDWLGREENRVLFTVTGTPWETPEKEGAPPGAPALSQ